MWVYVLEIDTRSFHSAMRSTIWDPTIKSQPHNQVLAVIPPSCVISGKFN